MYFSFGMYISMDRYSRSCCGDRQKPIRSEDYSSDIINSNVLQLAVPASPCSTNLAFLSCFCRVELCPLPPFPVNFYSHCIFEPILYHSLQFLFACLLFISQHCRSSAHTLTCTQLQLFSVLHHFIQIRHSTDIPCQVCIVP